jgi:L-fucose isomerase-like protein
MDASLTEQRRVQDDGLRVVNCFSVGREWTVPQESAPANYVPAAAVIRRGQALSGVTGRKAHAGGFTRFRCQLVA